jgi:glycosyltransferase involved in cell wall biosynthesis
MRVLLITDAYPPVFGGATRAAQQLGRQLRRRGHEVCVVTSWQRDLPAFEDDEGVQVHRLRGLVSRVGALSADPVRYTPPPFPDPEITLRFAAVLRRFAPDVVHAYGWLTYSCLPALWRRRVPVVLAAREYANVCAVRTLVRQGRERGQPCSGPQWAKCLDCAFGFYGRPKGMAAVLAVLGQRRALRRRIDALHSVSRYCEGMIRRYLLRGVELPREVLPDFREDDADQPPDSAILASLPEQPFILFVGSFRRIKGDTILLEAYLRLENPPPLVMVGARSREPLPEFPAGVTALIDVPHGTVMAIWDRALFGVCPSVVSEALGNTVHEGMSRGKAVIGTTPSGHDDMIVSGREGLLVARGDVNALVRAMQQLIAEPETCRRMGKEARVRARRFSADEVMPRADAFLVGVAANGRR